MTARPALARGSPGQSAPTIGDPDSTTPVNPEAAAAAAAEQADNRAAARSARSSQQRPAPRATSRAAPRRVAPASVRATPTSTPSPQPTAQPTPTPTPVASPSPTATTAPAAVTAPVASSGPATPVPANTTPTPQTTDISTTDTATQRENGGIPIWAFVLAGLALLALVAFLLLRRRDSDEEDEPFVQTEAYPMTIEPVVADEAVAADPEPYVEPVAMATPDTATVGDAEPEDVAALTAATGAVGDRPWLEFALRPVEAGGIGDDAFVEIDLTVGNVGTVEAQDVRITTYLLAEAEGDLSALLAERPTESVDPVTIPAGEGTRIEARLALPRAHVASPFTPVLVVDAVYRLANGNEARTAAAFVIGLAGDGEILDAVPLDGGMYADLDARLYREPEHS